MPAAIIFGVCVAVAAAAQTSLIPFVAIGEVKPNVVIVLLACIALVRGPVAGAGLGLLGGFLLAALEGVSLGQQIAGSMVASFLAGTLRGRIFTERPSVSLLVGFSAVIVAGAVSYLAAPRQPLLRWLQAIGLEAVYSAVLAIPFYMFARWVDRLLPGRADEGI
ncbi:MAG: rod shape-determining protein MreD [Armatimonadota bacterium]|jgi:rod shape-determining protein MreD